MGEFTADWLAMREAHDHVARSQELRDAFLATLPSEPRLVELGAGTGSGIRWLRRGSPNARWIAVDHDVELLRKLPADVATAVHDLRDLESLHIDVDGVCCQALLDLFSYGALAQLAAWVCSREVPLLAGLTVDGRVRWTPEDPADEAVQAAFRLHQNTDRGFGPSPGWRAASIVADELRMRGYRVMLDRADWEVLPAEVDLLTHMIEGTAAAAAEIHPTPDVVRGWRSRRLASMADLNLTVGHVDLLALPLSATVR